MHHLADWHLTLNGLQEAEGIPGDGGAAYSAPITVPSRDVEGGKQGGGTVAFVVVGHGAGPRPFFRGQAGLSAIKGLDLRLLIDREGRWRGRGGIDIEPDHVAQLGDELGDRWRA